LTGTRSVSAPTLWKTSIDGGAAPIQLTDKIASVPRVSPDGRFIACFYRAQLDMFSKLAVIAFDGGEPVKVFDKSPTTIVEAGIQWTPDGRALTFIDNRDGVSNIWLQPLDGSPAKQLTNFTSETIFSFCLVARRQDVCRRLVVCFVGCIFPDLIDLGPAIVNKRTGWSLPVVKIFPWHWREYSGSIYDGSRAVESSLYHLIVAGVCLILLYAYRRELFRGSSRIGRAGRS
jgi:hypothetical protein